MFNQYLFAKPHSRVVVSFSDAFILMLVLGGLAHQLHIPQLAVGYWTAWLIMAVSICVLPGNEYPVRIANAGRFERWAEERKARRSGSI